MSVWVEPFIRFRTYLLGTVGREFSLILLVLSLHPGDYPLGIHPVLWFPNLPQGDCQSGSIHLTEVLSGHFSISFFFLTKHLVIEMIICPNMCIPMD